MHSNESYKERASIREVELLICVNARSYISCIEMLEYSKGNGVAFQLKIINNPHNGKRNKFNKQK